MEQRYKVIKAYHTTHHQEIYLKSDRKIEMRESYRFVLDHIKTDYPIIESIVDVGCATGEFLYFLKQERPGISVIHGIDLIDNFFQTARENVPEIELFKKDIEDETFSHFRDYQVVVCMGVMSSVFEFEHVMRNLASLIGKNGTLYLFSSFNEDPIDVHAACRRAGTNLWESGKNLYSKKSVELFFENENFELSWKDFRFAKSISKTKDVLRAWTEPFRGDPNHCFYGTSQAIELKLLKIRSKT